MASTYTPLGVELMVTGENAGTWGTKTNTNLQLFEQISGGFKVQTLNAAGAGANTTALAVSDGSTGATLATRVIILGAESPETISGNKIVTLPNDVENFYFLKTAQVVLIQYNLKQLLVQETQLLGQQEIRAGKLFMQMGLLVTLI